MNATVTLEIGQMLTIDSATLTITAIKGRWVKLSNGASIGRELAANLHREYLARLELAAPLVAEPVLAPEAAFIAQVAVELDTTPDAAQIALMPVGYVGPMLRLRQRLQEGAYKKAQNGQPCCGDNVATLLGTLAPQQVIRACILAMALPGNPYLGLNLGQQSMNLRNKLRGCLKREEFGFGVLTEAVEQALEEDAK